MFDDQEAFRECIPRVISASKGVSLSHLRLLQSSTKANTPMQACPSENVTVQKARSMYLHPSITQTRVKVERRGTPWSRTDLSRATLALPSACYTMLCNARSPLPLASPLTERVQKNFSKIKYKSSLLIFLFMKILLQLKFFKGWMGHWTSYLPSGESSHALPVLTQHCLWIPFIKAPPNHSKISSHKGRSGSLAFFELALNFQSCSEQKHRFKRQKRRPVSPFIYQRPRSQISCLECFSFQLAVTLFVKVLFLPV